MAPSFVRSISFPTTPGRSSSKPRHIRSVSLPACTATFCHPLLADLKAHIAAVRSLTNYSLAASLSHIHALHSSIADLLVLPELQNALCGGVAAERLIQAFLLLADAHQGFQESLVDLKHAVTESSAALRRGDATRAASATRSQPNAEKELSRLAASVSTVYSKCARLHLVGTEDAEMAGALMEAAAASAAASADVFSAAASMSSSSAQASSCKKVISVFGSFGKKAIPETAKRSLERLHALEQCFDECDDVCQKVFRSIVQTRVLLLNIMSAAI
ncbi:unnamed protein product [Alopecurus aequalis]